MKSSQKLLMLAVIHFLVSVSAYGKRIDMAGTVSGYVFEDKNQNGVKDSGEPGIKGVSVSDQVNVAVSDNNGYYQLANTPGFEIIFVTVPDAYQPVGSFWKRIATNISTDFGMTRQAIPNSFTFIQASDTHTSEASIDRMDKFRAITDSVHPNLVIITGDLVKDALRVPETEAIKVYELFKKESSKIKGPLWLVPGNHEIFGIERHLSLVSSKNPLYGRNMYHHYFGPDYYSFNYGGIHFIGLNSLEFDDLFYYGHIDSIQLEWLKKDVATLASTTPVVTFQHVPFFTGGLSMAPYEADGLGRALENEKGKIQFRHIVSNAQDVLAILKDHPYPLALAGHYHFQQKFSLEGLNTRFEQTGAVIGPSTQGIINMPSGVMLYTVTNGKIDAGKFIRLDK
jgi:Calcineurin-like phosphoesterase/N terminal of Calcineurin-like phosphoesterase